MKRALERRTLFKRLPLYPALALAGIALAVLGFYAPWVTSARGLAALTYNAIDLAELCKFITRAGIANLTREWFLAPIMAAALALALWANSPAGTAPGRRWGAAGGRSAPAASWSG